MGGDNVEWQHLLMCISNCTSFCLSCRVISILYLANGESTDDIRIDLHSDINSVPHVQVRQRNKVFYLLGIINLLATWLYFTL